MSSKHLMKYFLTSDIYGITAQEFSLGRSNIQVVQQMLDAGIKVIQYREKDKKMDAMYEECVAIRKMTREAGAIFIVNDHIDLAIIVQADGVHIGQNDLPPLEVRKLIGEEMILGLSTCNPDEAHKAQSLGVVDYIGVGPIFSTQTKKDVCAPVGFDYLEYVVKNCSLPFVAIGGIKKHNIAEVKKRGAHMIALITEIVGEYDIKQRVDEIRAILHNNNG